MRVRLLAPHAIADVVLVAGEVLDLPPGVAVTVLMEPLDAEASEAIALERRRVWPDGIERNLTNGVEPPFSGGGPGR